MRSLRGKTTAVLAGLSVTVIALAAPAGVVSARHESAQYTLIDPGNLGGPQSFYNLPGVPLTKTGTLLGSAETAIADPYYPNFNPFMVGFPDPVVVHAFAWRKGVLVDLGALPGTNSSAVFEINSHGVGAGMSENGTIDPITGWPAEHAVLFEDGTVVDLGVLPGGYESQALAINDRGQVAGFASNGVADPVSFFGWGTQTRAFVWEDGVMTDIGTLGGPDSVLATLNARGQAVGDSFLNATPNATTGLPTIHPYLWDNGTMRDLGSLGGTLSNTMWVNDHGLVVGEATLAGDERSHPFLWDGNRLIDLGTLGGDNGTATYLNERGDVIGKADLPDGTHDAFVWRNGTMTPLVPVAGSACSYAAAINDAGDVVGNSSDCHGNIAAAMLWRDGVAYDLNTLVEPSPLRIRQALYIDDHGDIVCAGVLPNGDQRLCLLQRGAR